MVISLHDTPFLRSLDSCKVTELRDEGCDARHESLSIPLAIIRSDSSAFRSETDSLGSKQADFLVVEHNPYALHVVEMKGQSYHADNIREKMQSTIDAFFRKVNDHPERIDAVLFARHHHAVSLSALRTMRVFLPHGKPVPIRAKECGASI